LSSRISAWPPVVAKAVPQREIVDEPLPSVNNGKANFQAVANAQCDVAGIFDDGPRMAKEPSSTRPVPTSGRNDGRVDCEQRVADQLAGYPPAARS
jgi:hypothetical protein